MQYADKGKDEGMGHKVQYEAKAEKNGIQQYIERGYACYYCWMPLIFAFALYCTFFLMPYILAFVGILHPTVGHRPFPVQFAHASGQFHFLSAIMAEQKRSVSGCSSSSASKQSKRQVTVATCEKWQREFNRSYQTLLWLHYDVDAANRSIVDTLWCEVCRIYRVGNWLSEP